MCAPDEHVLQTQDCDDQEALINPAMVEICDELDNDCDEEIDEEAVDVDLLFRQRWR